MGRNFGTTLAALSRGDIHRDAAMQEQDNKATADQQADVEPESCLDAETVRRAEELLLWRVKLVARIIDGRIRRLLDIEKGMALPDPREAVKPPPMDRGWLSLAPMASSSSRSRRVQYRGVGGSLPSPQAAVRHFFTRLSTALVTLLPSFDSNFSGRLSKPKQCFQVSLSTS